MLIFENSSNSLRKICIEWVLSASAGGTGSFSAPAVTQLNQAEPSHEMQTFLNELRKPQNHHIEYPPQIEEVHCKIHINLVKYNLLTV